MRRLATSQDDPIEGTTNTLRRYMIMDTDVFIWLVCVSTTWQSRPGMHSGVWRWTATNPSPHPTHQAPLPPCPTLHVLPRPPLPRPPLPRPPLPRPPLPRLPPLFFFPSAPSVPLPPLNPPSLSHLPPLFAATPPPPPTMTTAHRATYKPARGAAASAGRALVSSAAVSGRDGVNHTVLKKRARLPLGASLDSDDDVEAGGSAGDPATGAMGGLVEVGVGTGAGAPLRARKRPALPAAMAAEAVAAAAARYGAVDADVALSGSDESDEEEGGGARGGRHRRRAPVGGAGGRASAGGTAFAGSSPGGDERGGGGAAGGGAADGGGSASEGSEAEASGADDDDDEDTDDDDAELLRELELIKAERAAERARAEAEADSAAGGDGGGAGAGSGAASATGTLGDNPLLADSAAASDAGTATTAYRVQRRWDDDLVFRHQTRGQVVPAKRFVNDTVRNDFHRRFLDKYIR